eukprot:1158545-Pelagomonas_calceolata.AAC.9
MQSWCGHTRARPPLLHAQVARTGRVVTLAAPQRMFANERQTVLEGFSGDVIGLTNPGAFGACADVRTCMCFASGRVCACLGMCSCLLQDMINLTNTRGACGAHAGAFVHMQTPLCTCGRLCSTRAGAHAGTHAGALGAHAGAHAGALGAQAGCGWAINPGTLATCTITQLLALLVPNTSKQFVWHLNDWAPLSCSNDVQMLRALAQQLNKSSTSPQEAPSC